MHSRGPCVLQNAASFYKVIPWHTLRIIILIALQKFGHDPRKTNEAAYFFLEGGLSDAVIYAVGCDIGLDRKKRFEYLSVFFQHHFYV